MATTSFQAGGYSGRPYGSFLRGFQYGRPAFDVTDGTWTPSTGVDLYATLDETVADDADYDTVTNPAADYFEVKFSAVTDPATDSGHIVRYRLQAVGGSANFTVALRQGAGTEIASWSHNGVSAVTTYEQTLTSEQANAITDYSDLRLRVTATV